MNCQKCGSKTRVLKSEADPQGNYTLRLRKCRKCGETMKTCEKFTFCPQCGGRLRTALTINLDSEIVRVKYCGTCHSSMTTKET